MIVDFEPEHLLKIQWQAHQGQYGTSRAHADAVAAGYVAKTLIRDGVVLMCAGIVEAWPGRGVAWSAIDWRITPAGFLEAHRGVSAVLDAAPFRRLEMYVKPGFLEAWIWAEMLGFQFESTMKAGAPDGRDLFVFARLNALSAYQTLSEHGSNGILRDSRSRSLRSGRNRVRRGREQHAPLQRADEQAQCDLREAERHA